MAVDIYLWDEVPGIEVEWTTDVVPEAFRRDAGLDGLAEATYGRLAHELVLQLPRGEVRYPQGTLVASDGYELVLIERT